MSSKQQPKRPTFYLDRNLGSRILAKRLRDAGLLVEIHDDHLEPAAPDEDWIELVAAQDWVALTRDKNIRYRAGEIEAVRYHSARVIVIRAKNSTAQDQADIIIKNHTKILRAIEKHRAPFILGIDRHGAIEAYSIGPL